MKASSVISSVLSVILKVIVISVVVLFIYRYAMKAYNFGFSVFAEPAVSSEPGTDISVAIVEGKSVKEIGQILEEKGLIRDKNVFYFQEMFSEYHGYIKPGIYELNTSMTIEDMLEVMADTSAMEEEKSDSK